MNLLFQLRCPEFAASPRTHLPRRRSHSSATRVGGPTAELPSRDRNDLHILRRSERHDCNSRLPLASGDHEFMNRSL